MSDKKYQQTYRIPSTRYKSHAYDGGIYFVTICTENKEHYFGTIDDDSTVVLSEIGQFMTEQISKTKDLRQDIGAEIPVFVVMPNHVHLIVCIDGVAPIVHSPRRDALNASPLNASHQENNESANLFGPQRKNLASIIRGIKSSVTGFANKNDIKFAWQSRFHDRIVRDYHELNRIADYIENNPFNWKNDDYY
ncbi:transposase [Petrimonas sp.]|uniref:transposase n=1 Tax=Petrimonas sp. TaxID=2023866 RepID=UPI003F5191DB